MINNIISRFLLIFASLFLAMHLTMAAASNTQAAEAQQTQVEAQVLDRSAAKTARERPREFRGNPMLLGVLSLLILTGFVVVFRALRGAKKSRAEKAWHE